MVTSVRTFAIGILCTTLTVASVALSGERQQTTTPSKTDYSALERILEAAKKGDGQAQDAIEKLLLEWKRWKAQSCACSQSEAQKVQFQLDPSQAVSTARLYCEREYRCLSSVGGAVMLGDRHWTTVYCCR